MISAFVCQCNGEKRNDSFEIIREIDIENNKITKIYFRCNECGKDYQLQEITQ